MATPFTPQPLKTLACTHCDGAGLELHPGGRVLCKFCGTANLLAGRLCPRCEFVNAEGLEICANCQATLFRVCLNCQTKNWSGAETCVRCGRALDTLDHLIDRLQEDTSGRLNRQQHASAALKATEDAAAERRLEQLRDIDRRREQAQAEAIARRAARERQLMLSLAIGFGLLVIIVLAAIVLKGLLP